MKQANEYTNEQEQLKPVVTKDYWTIILLIARDFKPLKIEVITDKSSGQQFLQFVFSGEARELYDMKQRGEVIPIDDFAKVEYASRIFKSNLHLVD